MRSIILSVLIVLVSTQVQAQEEKSTGKPGVVRVETATITATVEGIDYDKRTVDLKGPRGNMVTLKVGPEAKNFKQIKTGDHVTAKYYRATAIYVRKPDEPCVIYIFPVGCIIARDPEPFGKFPQHRVGNKP